MKQINTNRKDPLLDEAKLYPIGFYFDYNVTASQLIHWLSSANDYRQNEEQNSLLSNIGWHVLPDMVNCKNEKTRIKSLDQSWNEIFDYDGYKHNRKYLADIGRSFLQSYEKVSEAPEFLFEFLRIYKILFVILEMKEGLSYTEINNLNEVS